MPGSTVTAPAMSPVCAAPSAAFAPESGAAAAGCTGRAAGSVAERSSTGGVPIHARASALTRGAAHTAASIPSRHRVQTAARRADRLWE